MENTIRWFRWSPEQLSERLVEHIVLLDSNLELIPAEYREKNRAIIKSLTVSPVSPDAIRDDSRNAELIPLAYALDTFGREAAKRGHTTGGLGALQAAHEIFRNTSKLQPSRAMRNVVQSALRIILVMERPKAIAGEVDAGLIREALRQFVIAAWGQLPSQMVLEIDELILDCFEESRRLHEDDVNFHERFVRDNIEAVLALEIPRRLERIRKHWEDIGEHIAPNATRIATLAVQRAQELGELLNAEVWSSIRQAVERGDVEALAGVLAESEASLEANLRLRLDAKPEFRQPIAEVRFRGGVDKFFIEARDLLMSRDSRALRKFSNLHFSKSTNPIAKEWYAYTLGIFGTATDIHEIIRLLEDAISSEYFRPDVNWTARWNLACALRRLPDRADEALDHLLPVLDNDAHTSEVFELCLLWAIEQRRDDILTGLLLKSPSYEAHLLAALHDSEALANGSDVRFDEHFRRISRILRNPDHVFPDPKEHLIFDDLDRLTRDFIETGLVSAGTEWFRQRVSYGQEHTSFKNWECAARLAEEGSNFGAAWRCRRQAWILTQRNPRTDAKKKTSALKGLLSWSGRHGFEEEALAVLRSGWRDTNLTDADFQLWERRLEGRPEVEVIPSKPSSNPIAVPPVRTEHQEVLIEPVEADRIIQDLAGSFATVSRPEVLASKREDAKRLVAAVRLKHPNLTAILINAVRSIVDLSSRFDGKVPEEEADSWMEELKSGLAVIRSEKGRLPFELSGLAQACERVVQSIAVRARAIPEVVITPPSDLKLSYRRADIGQYTTRTLARISNPGQETVSNLQVSFISTSMGVDIPIDPILIPPLRPSERRIVECPLELSAEAGDAVAIRAVVNFDSGGFTRTVHATGSIPIIESWQPIPSRYITSGPISADRPDLFHGRDKELRELSENFLGDRMGKLFFVNGIRAVGKSTLMRHLGRMCGAEVLSLLLDVETALGSEGMNAMQLVRQLCRLALRESQAMLGALSVEIPDARSFELDPPWVVLDTFLENLSSAAGKRKILLCFDELQRLVKRIADPNDPMDDGFLGWIRDKIQFASSTFVICTGSESFGKMRKRYDDHTVWRNMEPYDISFVDRSAMERIATFPVREDGVHWLPEALERLWDFTEGHPSVTQLLSGNVARILNEEGRRVVAPQDVERAADAVPPDHTARDVWWNEKEGMITPTHRQIAFLILQNQEASRVGVEEGRLAELAQRAGVRTLGRHLDEMRALEVLAPNHGGQGGLVWRLKGAFLEQHVTRMLLRVLQESEVKTSFSAEQPLALMLDLENVKIRLNSILKEMPSAKYDALKDRIQAPLLATRLLEAASKYGFPRQRWAVADWDQQFFKGDQKIFKTARYSTDIAGSNKSNSSDHVLREKIHFVLREHPEISTYVIGTGDADFHETIKTLQEKGKAVVLWSTRDSINRVYGESLRGPDRIRIEWLEDIVFGEAEVSGRESEFGEN